MVSRESPPAVISQKTIDVVDGYFELEATYNTGAFHGIGSGYTFQLAILSAVAVLIIVGILFFSLRQEKPPSIWFVVALGSICGGTVGNFYDRWVLEGVRDWIKWYFVASDGSEKVWPNFNIADSGICVGVGLLILLEIGNVRRERRERLAAANAPEKPAS